MKEANKDMATVKADLELCQGYANCVVGADDVFDIDEDGVVVILADQVAPEEVARVDAAAQSCPVSAVWLEDT
ncbi:ferredoxin [Aeromicrobium sp. CTD01-1L150]|uniref:ferredoxin n=1 Tax=Aeromicrobium sp. CTD01-1L150 TaxID=3341830 RepID=UPI0035BEC829